MSGCIPMNAALAWRLVAVYARIRLLCFESNSAYVRFSLSAVVPADMITDMITDMISDMIKAPFVLGAREDRIYIPDLMRA
jgi:hypothetical protein